MPLFINIGSGSSVVTTDFIAALNQRKLSAAGLDVTDTEQLPADKPPMANEKHFDYSAYSGIYQEYAEDVVQISQENLEKYRQDGTMKEIRSI